MKSLIFSLFILLAGSLAYAQEDVPPSGKPGECYAKFYVPNEYEFKEVTEIDKPAYTKTVDVPPVYETVYDTTVVRPAQKKLQVLPAVYETVVEEVMIAPATTKWKKGPVDPSCLSPNPEDCRVLCLVEVPAEYKKFERRVLKTPSRTREVNIPAEIKVTSRKVMVKPATTKEVTVPPTYKTVMKRVVSKEGGYTEWKPILCGPQMTREVIKNIQLSLLDAGYKPGEPDGIVGAQTAEALMKYQKDNDLAHGNLYLETVDKLGVDY